MNKRAIFRFCILLVGIMVLSGCAKVDEVSKDKEKIMVNYMARAVSDHSKTTRNKLVSVRKKDKEESKSNEELAKEDAKSRAVPEKPGPTMGEVLGCKDIGFKISSVSLQSSYKEGSYFHLTPKNTKKELLVIRLKMKNESSRMINFQTGTKNIQYCIHNDKNIISPLMTLAQDDIMYLEIKLKPNETGNALLFYQVNKGQKYVDTYLEVSCDGKVCKMPFNVDKK